MFWLLYAWKLPLLAIALVVGVVAALHRRRLRRKDSELATDLDRLARLQPGGTPESPLEVPSASVVEVRALDQECHACGARRLNVERHSTEAFGEDRLRVLRIACVECGAERDVYVRIAPAM